jgi:hypothetical protein
MLKVGDVVTCVSNELVYFPPSWPMGARFLDKELTVGKQYTIKEICENKIDGSDPGTLDYPKESYSVVVNCDGGFDTKLNAWRFLDQYKK